VKNNWGHAVNRARQTLSAEMDYLLRAEEFSVAFKYALSENEPNMTMLSQLAKITPTYPDAEKAFKALKNCPHYRSRILQIAREKKRSEALAPELLIYPSPVTPQQISTWTSGEFFHGLICTDMHLFTNEFYALAIDAFTSDSSITGRPRFNLLGIKDSWIDEQSCATRAILVDFERLRLIETDLPQPQKLDSVQFISLGRNEIEVHQALSERLECIQVNPFKYSWPADDKISSYKLWKSRSIPIPDTLPITKINRAAISFVEQHEESILKPNFATGGQGATFLRSEIDLHRVWANNSVDVEWILQARKDTVLFKKSDNDQPQTLVIRLNVGGQTPSSLKVESVYTQIGADRWSPASTKHDSRIISKQDLKGKTGYIEGKHWRPLELNDLFWSQAYTLAEQAASIYPGLFLAGIDLIVDVDSTDQPTCIVLEANARPAGLCRSRCIKDGKPKISSQLWKTLYDSICFQKKEI
jgi:hypothetical protein